jgi:hypothetical protein
MVNSTLPVLRPADPPGPANPAAARFKNGTRTRPDKPDRAAVCLVCVSIFAGLALSGCGRTPGQGSLFAAKTAETGRSTSLVVEGDWDDVESAILVGLDQAEMAQLRRRTPSADEVVVELITLRDQPGTLRLSREPATGDGPTRITIEASVGRAREAELERGLVRAVARRLEDLRGVEFAPVR